MHDICGIKASPQSGFQNGDIHLFVPKMQKGDSGKDFKHCSVASCKGVGGNPYLFAKEIYIVDKSLLGDVSR